MVNAADAVLATHGYRLRGKTGSHEARFEFPLLPAGFRAARQEIEAGRKLRNVAMYDRPGIVPPQTGRDVTEAAARLVAEVAALIK